MNQPEGRNADKRKEAPFPPGSSSPTGEEQAKKPVRTLEPAVPLRNPRTLERLRDRVQEIALEFSRLREENAALYKRIEALESDKRKHPTGASLVFQENPDVMRRKIQGFIDALDEYLQHDYKSPS